MPYLPEFSRVRPEDALLLYRVPDPVPTLEGALPALRHDLIDRRVLIPILKLVAFFLPPSAGTGSFEDYMARVTAECAYVPIGPRFALNNAASLTELINLLPAINAWLVAWRDAPDREPPANPAWAKDHVDSRIVDAFAKHVYQIASPRHDLTLRLCSMAGKNGTVIIPERSRLTGTNSNYRPDAPMAEVADIQKAAVGSTSGGQATFILGAAFEPAASAMRRIVVKASALRRVQLLTAKGVRRQPASTSTITKKAAES